MAAWQLQEAKNKLSELIERALTEGPQVITRHGEEVVVVVPALKYRKMMAPKQRFGDFLMASPLRNSKLEVTRDRTMATREINL